MKYSHTKFCLALALQLRAAAAQAPESVEFHAPLFALTVGPLTVRCKHTSAALLAMATKYETGARKRFTAEPLPLPYTLKRPHDADARLLALEAETITDTVEA